MRAGRNFSRLDPFAAAGSLMPSGVPVAKLLPGIGIVCRPFKYNKPNNNW
jgi:hypothetical protein